MRQEHLILHHLHIEKVSFADLVEARQLERMPNERIHGDDPLKHEKTLALVNFASPQAGLLANSSLECLSAHALSQLPIVGVTRRL